MKRIFIILLPLLLCLVSCGAPEPLITTPSDGEFWVSPSIIEIGNYYREADPDHTEAIIRVHCSDKPRNEYTKWLVETYDKETEVEFTLKAPLAEYDTDKLSVISSDINEEIKLISYHPATNTILVGGFLPNSKRYVEVRYPAYTRYLIRPIEPYENNLYDGCDMPPKGYTQWVKIDTPVFVLKPNEVKNISVKIDVPDDTVIKSDRWEYWLEVCEAPICESSGVSITSATRIRCVVNMKG